MTPRGDELAMVNVSVPRSLRTQFKLRAVAEGVSVRALIERLMRDYVNGKAPAGSGDRGQAEEIRI